jgi:hypothetical protein
MTTEHPITPPPDRIHNWLQLEKVGYTLGQIITLAAQWGADMELEACCKWLRCPANTHLGPSDLRADRRPKPPSLKEQALAVLDDVSDWLDAAHENTIRRALEQLDD